MAEFLNTFAILLTWRFNNQWDRNSNFFAEMVQRILEIVFAFHRINGNETSITKEDLRTCITSSQFTFRSDEEGISKELTTIDLFVPQRATVRS